MLTRTKTTRADKKVRSRVLHVDRNCWLVHLDWIPVCWKLWEESAPWEQDHFLPVPTKALNHRERYEYEYAEATVFSQVLETKLILNGKNCCVTEYLGGCGESTARELSSRAVLAVSCTQQTGKTPLAGGLQGGLKLTCVLQGSGSARCKQESPKCSAKVVVMQWEKKSLRGTWEITCPR